MSTGLTTTTDGNGYYRFDNLMAGTYIVEIDGSTHDDQRYVNALGPRGVIGVMTPGPNVNVENGTVFALNTNGTGFTILHAFAAKSGSWPNFTNTDGFFLWIGL